MPYLGAVGLFLVAASLRLLILPVESRLAFLTFYPAVLAAYYWCGKWPGRLTVGLCAATAYYIFTPPHWSWAPTHDGVWSVSLFVVFALILGRLIERLKTSTAQLELSEQRYKAILEDQSEVICRFSADGTVLFVNDAYCRLFGVKERDILGKSWAPLVYPEDLLQVNQTLARLSPHEPIVTLETRVFGSAGVVRWVQFVNHAFFDGKNQLLETQSVGREISDRKALEAEVAESAKALEDLYNNAPFAYYSLDTNGTYLRINTMGLAWLGCARDELIGKLSPLDFLTDHGKEVFRKSFLQLKAEGRIDGWEFDLVCRDGAMRRMSMSATAVMDDGGRFLFSRSVMFDISEMHRIRTEMRALTREQNAMLDNELVGIIKVHNRVMVWKNKAQGRIFGYDNDELLGQPTRILYADEASYLKLGAEGYPTLKSGQHYRTQIQMRRKNGDLIWVEVSGVTLSEDSKDSLWMMVDITELKHHQQQVEHIAFHDALTGLPNRLLLADRLNQALSFANRLGYPLAVCYLDLDGFKQINDQYGHSAGDVVLKEVADRLCKSVRANDTVARLGGDEFVLVLTPIEGPQECTALLQRVLARVQEPIALDAAEAVVHVGCSIGVAMYPSHSRDGNLLLTLADAAMFTAKRAGRSQIRFHRP